MTNRSVDRLLLILFLEVGVLVGFLSFAQSAFGAWVSPGWVAALMLGAWTAAPAVVLLPAFAARPERLTRGLGLAALSLGAASTLIRSHETADLTLILLGFALFTDAVRRGPDPGIEGRAGRSA
jgi:hypothetical protein